MFTEPRAIVNSEQGQTSSWKGAMEFFIPHPFKKAKILPFKALLLLSKIEGKKTWSHQCFTQASVPLLWKPTSDWLKSSRLGKAGSRQEAGVTRHLESKTQ